MGRKTSMPVPSSRGFHAPPHEHQLLSTAHAPLSFPPRLHSGSTSRLWKASSPPQPSGTAHSPSACPLPGVCPALRHIRTLLCLVSSRPVLNRLEAPPEQGPGLLFLVQRGPQAESLQADYHCYASSCLLP